MSNVAQEGGLCPKCGSQLRVSWCAQCFGTGRSGKHKCKACDGKGRTTACPNVRSHKLNLFKFARIFPKRLALFFFARTYPRADDPGSPRRSASTVGNR